MINVGTAVGFLDLDITGFSKGYKSALADLKVLKDETATSVDKFKAVGSAMTSVGGSMTKQFTLPLAAAGAASIKLATDFDNGMAKVSTIADTTVMSIKDLGSGVMKLSSDTGVSTDELNEGLYQVLSATNDTANALDYLEVSAKLAKGGFTDVNSAIDGATSVMNAYGKTGKEEFEKVADVMVMTQNLGKTTVNELAGSLFNVVPAATAAGISFEQVGAAMATMTAQGTPTSVATTQLRSAIQAFTAPNAEMQKTISGVADEMIREQKISGPLVEEYQKQVKVFQDLIEKKRAVNTTTAEGRAEAKKYDTAIKEQQKTVFEAAGGLGSLIMESEGLAGAFKIVTDAADGNTLKMSNMLGSVEAVNSVLQLTSEQGAEKYRTSLEGMGEAAGATGTAFEKMQKSAGAQFQMLLNDLKILGVQFGTLLLPPVLAITKGIKSFLDVIINLPEPIKAIVVVIGGIVAAIGPLLTIAGKIITNIKTLATIISTLKTVITGFTTVFKILNTVLLANPIGIIITLIGLLVAAFIYLWNNCEEFREFWIKLWEGIKSVVKTVVDAISNFFTVTIPETFKKLLAWINQNWVEPWNRIWESVGNFFKNAWNSYVETVRTVLSTILNIILTVTAAIKQAWETVWNAISTFFKTLWDGIKASVTAAINFIKDIIKSAIDIIKNTWTTGWTAISEFFKNIWNVIKTFVSSSIESVRATISNVLNLIRSKWQEVWNAIKSFFINIWENIKTSLSGFLNNIVSAVRNIGDSLRSAAETVFNNMKNGIMYVWNTIVSWFSNAIHTITNTVLGIKDKIFDAGKNILNSMWDGLKDAWNSIKTWFEGVIKNITDWFTDIWDKVTGAKDAVNESKKITVNGSHANGLAYVPFDGYIAELHKGERVLTAEENRKGQYRTSADGDVFNFYSPVPLTPVESAREMKKAKQELSLGFI